MSAAADGSIDLSFPDRPDFRKHIAVAEGLELLSIRGEPYDVDAKLGRHVEPVAMQSATFHHRVNILKQSDRQHVASGPGQVMKREFLPASELELLYPVHRLPGPAKP